MKLAPIVLFVYNRPYHTEQTLNALYNNKLASDSELYIFADGPRHDMLSKEELKDINDVRLIIRKKKWCGKVNIIEKEKNEGLALSIVAGVSSVVNMHGKVIVLEDDLVTSPNFLEYMNDNLDYYKDEERVFQISGFMIPHARKISKIFFYRAPGSWGWGTWKRAWDFYTHSTEKLINEFDQLTIRRFDIDGTYPYFQHLELNHLKKMNTWAVRWYASIFLQDGLTLWPGKSYVRNIGHDGTGENCGERKEYFLKQILNTKRIRPKKRKLEENPEAVALFKFYYTNKPMYIRSLNRRGLLLRVAGRIYKKVFN